MTHVRIGLIGSGFMGRAHAVGFRQAPLMFTDAPSVDLHMLADVDEMQACVAADRLGFRRSTGDWRRLVADPDIDVVAITSPNHLHKEMAEAAAAAGKHVYCEKPLALSAADAWAMTAAVEAAGVKTLVGFNYLCNPAIQLARDLLAAGEIGEVLHFRGIHNEDFMADPAQPYSWRCQRARCGSGALGDLGSHALSLARFLVGEVDQVCGDLQTVIAERRDPANECMRAVENDDQAHFMVRFAGGAIGTIEASRVAHGRKIGLTFEINGSKGSVAFDQERMNELAVYDGSVAAARCGFRTILTGPAHPYYAAFCPAPGHGLGFNDLKVIEVYRLLRGLDADEPLYPDFRQASRIQAIVDAVEKSAAKRSWVKVAYR